MMMYRKIVVVMLLATLVSSGFCQDCSSDPCEDGAPCVNATLGYYCQCPVVPVSASSSFETVYSGQNCDESFTGVAGCNINYYDSEGNITSPGYPNDYPNLQDCYSHLKIADATQITLILEEFNLEPQVKDTLLFGKGPAIYEVDPMQPDIYEFGGDLTSLPLSERTYVFNDTNQIFFYFYSDKNEVYPGYRISYTADIDSCVSGPCLNNATCMDEYYDYSCICAPGYTGRNCGVDINECGSMPCDNGGNCMDLVNGHFCDCPMGFSGDYCEINKDECMATPCRNGGSCTDGIAGYTCTCAPGWDDPNCQTRVAGCNINYYDSEGNITSPGYPNDYPNRQDCYSHLKIADATQITLILEEFDLESPLKDTLIFGKGPQIYEVDPNQPDIYERGNDLAGLSERTYVFNDTNQIFFYFFSDKNVGRPGYRISYTAGNNANIKKSLRKIEDL
eukprot:XP_011684262.1 PREDICTED: fibropellin-3-like [Strongylocentrotus purpuratus]